ncbi:MAG: DUF5615 family PIN-like protein [Anaerolineae bacterium]
MKFLADECCDASLVEALRADGHNVLYAVESLKGALDEELLARAVAENRIVLTEDKDFGELVYRLRMPVYGIILLRFRVRDRDLKIPSLRRLLRRYEDRLPGSFVVLEARRARIRPLPGLE